MKKSEVEAYLNRDWDLVEQAKADYWSERKKTLTPVEALRIGDELRKAALLLHPDWPSPEERREDIDVHSRVSALLRRVI